MPDKHVIVEKHQTLSVYEESVLPLNTILLLLLAFLMLIVLIFVRKRREKKVIQIRLLPSSALLSVISSANSMSLPIGRP